MIRRPPQHAADTPPTFIARRDDAWDHERIKRERKALKDGAAHHPVSVYRHGSSRHDLDAPVTIGGQSVTPRQYLLEGVPPTVFHLRRDAQTALKRSQAIAVLGDPQALEAAVWDLVRHGVVKVTEGFDDRAPWPLEGGGPFPLTDADMHQLHDAGAGLIVEVGYAVLHVNAPLSDIEGKA